MKGCACVLGEWLLTPFRMAIHEPTRTGVVADLHLDYCVARRHGGDAIPARPLDEQLGALIEGCAALDITRIVIAGDLCEARLTVDLAERFLATIGGRGLSIRAIVPGNHDRGWQELRDRLPLSDGYRLGDWHIVHGDGQSCPRRSVLGHFHPAYRSGTHNHACYLVGAEHLVLPAYSPDAAGGNVRGAPAWQGFLAYVIEGQRVVNRGVLKPAAFRRRRPFRLGR